MLDVRGLSAGFGRTHALRDITVRVHDHEVLALIGPSGCGKSTLLRCMNRMLETVPGAWIDGEVRIDGTDIHAPGVDAVAVRRIVGMVLQRPTPFPSMSIAGNVGAGLSVLGAAARKDAPARIENALRRAALWDEVKDRLDASPLALSGGQQQRLCIARALAMEPRALLLDEPTASLDPISTQHVEALVHELRREIPIVFVTHNMQQAARTSDRTVYLLGGELIEEAATQDLFTHPRDPRTEAFVTGRFG